MDVELRKIIEQMQQADLNPLQCDTPVPLVDVPVLAGLPAEAGDAAPYTNYVMVPRELLGRNPVFLIDARGLSMREAGIMPGDRLEVELTEEVADGDIVVAEVDGAFTVKTLFTDAEGQMWLVPQNGEYDPIALTGKLWRIIGRVIGVRKGMARTPYSDCIKAVKRMQMKAAQGSVAEKTRKQQADAQPENIVFKSFYNRQRIDFAAIRKYVERVVVMQMKHRYEWYAVYRVMMDLQLLDELRLTRFAQQMQLWFPELPLCCTADTLGDYAVGHTGKAFTLWNAEQFRQEMRRGQTMNGFNVLFHRCEELRAALFPLPVIEMGLPM